MNAKGISILVILIFIVAGGAFFFGRSSQDTEEINEATIEDSTNPPITTAVPANIVSTARVESENEITLASVSLGLPGYVVVHRATEENTPGDVIGNSSLLANGTSENVVLSFSEDITEGDVLFLMLHQDDGNGTYEFPGPDGPIMTSKGTPVMTRIIVGEEGGDIMTEIEVMEDSGEVAMENTVTAVVYMTDGFEPREVTVAQGDSVRFTNESAGKMWVASDIHPTHTLYPVKSESDCLGSSFDACTGIETGESWEYTFTEAGIWKYHDHLKAGRRGTVTVE